MEWIDSLLLLLVLTNLALLGSSRIIFSIRMVAFQGILLGLIPVLQHTYHPGVRFIILAILALGLKGIVFPWLLLRTLRAINVRHEIEPFVSYAMSIVAGVIALSIFIGLGIKIDMPFQNYSQLAIPVSFFTISVGLFLIIARKKALTQILGYLVMENGIYTFGAMTAIEQPWLVEMGVLLDVFVAVFIMGITIFHINREFNHMDTHRMAYLNDWKKSSQVETSLKKTIILKDKK